MYVCSVPRMLCVWLPNISTIIFTTQTYSPREATRHTAGDAHLLINGLNTRKKVNKPRTGASEHAAHASDRQRHVQVMCQKQHAVSTKREDRAVGKIDNTTHLKGKREANAENRYDTRHR